MNVENFKKKKKESGELDESGKDLRKRRDFAIKIRSWDTWMQGSVSIILFVKQHYYLTTRHQLMELSHCMWRTCSRIQPFTSTLYKASAQTKWLLHMSEKSVPMRKQAMGKRILKFSNDEKKTPNHRRIQILKKLINNNCELWNAYLLTRGTQQRCE